MTITRDDIRPLEDAVSALLCLQSAWREAGGPSEEPSAYFYGRFYEDVEGLHGAFNEMLGKLSGTAEASEQEAQPASVIGSDARRLALRMEEDVSSLRDCWYTVLAASDIDQLEAIAVGVLNVLDRDMKRALQSIEATLADALQEGA